MTSIEELVKSMNRFCWAIPLLTLQQTGRPVAAAFARQAAWQELQNKLEAFSLFQQVDAELDIQQDRPWLLHELVERVRQLDRYRSVWLMEGLGHYHSQLRLRQAGVSGNILSGAANGQLPKTSLVPLHAGMGLSLAEWLLPSIEQNPTQSLRTFIEACRTNSQPEYFGVACEALGLATRNLFPHLLVSIDQALSQAGEEYVAYFWHGAGRAIYFSPANFLPWRAAPWLGLDTCLRESPHSLGRQNAIAGFCWALMLVNIRQPAIIETFFKCHAREIIANDACWNGISSALLIWADATACARCLDALQRHRPDPSVASLWHEYVRRSCEAARQFLSGLHSRRAMGRLFRYQQMGEVFHSLRYVMA